VDPRASAALAALGAVFLSGHATAQAPALVGTWMPAERAVPEPLPLDRAVHERAAPEPCAVPDSCAALDPCAVPGMPALLETRGAVEISQQSDQVRFRYAEWDTTRTVYTSPRNRPPAQEPSPLGVSFGRWERDTLAIFTTYISYPYFDRVGTVQSAAVSVLERYTASADGARLDWQVTVTDAATFSAPVVIVGAMTRTAPAVLTDGAASDTQRTDAPNAENGARRTVVPDGTGAALVASSCVR
jgi:hypothetical protein